MTQRKVQCLQNTLNESNTVGEARKLMTEKHIRHIPVTDENKHLRGLVTQLVAGDVVAQASVIGGDAVPLRPAVLNDGYIVRTRADADTRAAGSCRKAVHS